MKRIHIFLHVPYETPGCIETWIKEKGYFCSSTELYAGEVIPDISEVDWLIVMGGPMSVHDTDIYPWLLEEKKFIEEAVTREKVIIGICLGSQLIAEVLGSSVYKNNFKEIGWLPVEKNPEIADLSLLKRFNEIETVFHWHGDTFSIPNGAVHGFSSEGCVNQCFIYNNRIIGLQFHVEVMETLLESMIENGIDELVPDKYIQDAALMRRGAHNIKRNNELMFSILDGMDELDV
ncbi:MAG: amidotransferase [Spirochaetae bacterium HGW-Spirochaetae-5]|nr:MAG: amidotransferase [Spirochaetae bacterium HGW-Spirochaetae-5]